MKFEYSELNKFAYSSDKYIKGEIKGIVLNFTGLNGTAMINKDPDIAVHLCNRGIVYLHPYINPWAWMNRGAVWYTDACIEALFEHYNLPDSCPIISQGGSMGGLCALVYPVYAKRTPAAVVASCPVCDLPYHFTERNDLPRTLISAFSEYPMDLEAALETSSPIHLAAAGEMPDIPYFIAHCEADMSVNKEKHSDRLVEVLSKTRKVEYITVPGRGHTSLTPEATTKYWGFVEKICLGQ